MKYPTSKLLSRAGLTVALCLGVAAHGAATQETKELAQRQRDLRSAFSQQVKEKKFDEANATVAALRETLANPACPPDAAGAIMLHLGKAFVDPLNLRFEKEAREFLREAADKAVRPMERASAILLLHRLDLLTCDESRYEAEAAATKAFVEDLPKAGLSSVESVRFLRDTVWPIRGKLPFDFDIVAAMDRAAGTNGIARTEFYGGPRWGAVFIMSRAVAEGSLDPEMSREARLALIERGLADKYVANHSALPQLKVTALVELGRGDEAERFILDGIATTNFDLRVGGWYDLLGTFYENTSKRYYAKPDKALVAKAIEAYGRSVENGPPPHARQALADLCIASGDYAAARRAIDGLLSTSNGVTNDVAAIRIGNLAYAQGDYAGAAAAWSLLVRPDIATLERLATAFNAIGDYGNCIATLEKLIPQVRNRYKKPRLEFCLKKARERAEAAKGASR